jgi:hypothetical protein
LQGPALPNKKHTKIGFAVDKVYFDISDIVKACAGLFYRMLNVLVAKGILVTTIIIVLGEATLIDKEACCNNREGS